MTYTAAEMLTLIASIGVLLTAVGAVIVNIIVALRTTAKVAAVESKTDELVQKVEAVHTVTNSGLALVKAELATANTLNATLLETIRDLKNEREKSAIATAIVPSHDVTARTRSTDTLRAIETNTAATVDAADALKP